MKILRRNLSLMLAVRYLNPLRTMFSIITLICLGGVALGVMILIVVLSVMEGLQKEMEEKGFALQPHYTATLSDAFTGSPLPITPQDCDWPAVAEELREVPGIVAEYKDFIEAHRVMPYRAQTVMFKLLRYHMDFCTGLAKCLIPKCLGAGPEAAELFQKFFAEIGTREREIEACFDQYMMAFGYNAYLFSNTTPIVPLVET